MLACIACAKQDPDDGGEDGGSGARPSGKEAVKSLSSQIKDMVLKISGSARQSKGSGSSSSFSSTSFRSKSFRRDPRHRQQQQHRGSYTYEDAAHYAAATSGSTAAMWDLMEEEKQREDRDHDEPKEWVAQVEPGVHITFVSLPPGGAGNDLKRIRFSREMFNKWQAQRWWGENYDRIMELYNVQRYNRQALQTPARSDDGERESSWSRVGSTKESPITTERLLIGDTDKPPSTADGKGAQTPSPVLPHRLHSPSAAAAGAGASGVKAEASRTTTSSRDEASVSASNASDLETTEWVEQDEPGVYITIRELADGTRELRRVRFSREKFGEVHAKLWWEANRERIHAQYL